MVKPGYFSSFIYLRKGGSRFSCQKQVIWKIIKNALLSAGFCIFFMAGTTNAFFTDSEGCINSVFVGDNTTKITEKFPDSDPKPLDENPEYSKTVWVENTSYGVSGHQADCYVRISLSYSDYDIAKGLSLQQLNTTDWVYDKKDEYYNYRYPLKEGEKSKPLFTGFSIDGSKTADAKREGITDFSIHIYEESVQADGFSDYQSAWDYYLNPVVI